MNFLCTGLETTCLFQYYGTDMIVHISHRTKIVIITFFFRYIFNMPISGAILRTFFCVKSRRHRQLYYIVLAVQVLCAQRPKEKHNNFPRRLSLGLLYVIVEAEVSACMSVCMCTDYIIIRFTSTHGDGIFVPN